MFFLAATLVGWIGGDFVYRKLTPKNIFLWVCLRVGPRGGLNKAGSTDGHFYSLKQTQLGPN